jgi:hypothetical protein
MSSRGATDFSAIAQAYRNDVQTYCATVSISQLADLPKESSAAYQMHTADFDVAINGGRETERTAVDLDRPSVLRKYPRAFSDPSEIDRLQVGQEEFEIGIDPVVPKTTKAEEVDIVTRDDCRQPQTAVAGRLRTILSFLALGALILLTLGLALFGLETHLQLATPANRSLSTTIGQSAKLGLLLRDIKTATELDDGVPVLLVVGTISNESSNAIKVPRLHFAVRDWSGGELYSWTTILAQTELAPSATLKFRSRLTSPPRQAEHVRVSFFHAGDLIGTARASARWVVAPEQPHRPEQPSSPAFPPASKPSSPVF